MSEYKPQTMIEREVLRLRAELAAEREWQSTYKSYLADAEADVDKLRATLAVERTVSEDLLQNLNDARKEIEDLNAMLAGREISLETEETARYKNALSIHVEGLKRAYADNAKLREALSALVDAVVSNEAGEAERRLALKDAQDVLKETGNE